MTFASNDNARVLMDECRRFLPELRNHGEQGEDFLQAATASLRSNWDSGIHEKRKLKSAVRRDMREKFGSFLLLAIAGAIIHFLVVRFLEWKFPKTPEVSE